MKIIKGIFIFIILATIVYYINPKNLIYISGKEYNLNILYFLPFALILFLSVDNFIIKRKNISIVTIQNIKLLIKVSTIWIAWIILCTVFNHIIYRDFDKYITESILALIKWTSGFLVLITGTIFIKWHEKELKTALILMMIAALFVQLYLIFIKDLYNNFAYLTRGFAYLYWKEIGKNELSGSLVLFLLIALSLLIHQKKDISITFFIVFILTGLACIVFLMSREGFLTLFIGIVTFIF